MTGTSKLASLRVSETSGVDHPAHLHPGWLLKKSVGSDTATALVRALGAGGAMPTKDSPALSGLLKSLGEAKDYDAKLALLKAADHDTILKDLTAADIQPAADQVAEVWKLLRDLADKGNPDAPSADGVPPVAPVAAAPAVTPDATAVLASLTKSVGPEAAEAFRKQLEETADLRKRVEQNDLAKMVDLVKSEYGTVFGPKVGDDELTGFAKALSAFEMFNADAAKVVKDALSKSVSLNASAEAILTKELGAGATPVAGSTVEKINAIAKAMQDADGKLTFPVAFQKALESQPGLYEAYRNESTVQR